ncbi:hypothetical protein M422DRAFT_777740 [Sphaerobolus stellatus SS14]|nr:hypothetical protein M422DRAFT_777740 [Sphaerobolus stellatus SS14]
MTASFVIPAPDDVRKKTVAVLGRPGSGKTLPLWIPSLFNNGGITAVIIALSILGEQNKNELEAVGIKAVSVTASNAFAGLYKDIAACKYLVVIVPPECAKSEAQFQKILSTKSFVAKLFNIVIDEAHCIFLWDSVF